MSRCGSCPIYDSTEYGVYCPGDYGVEECTDKLQDLYYAMSGEIKSLKISTSMPSNVPLTLEQLREMDGEPVWITPGGFWALVIVKPYERPRLICNDGEIVWADKEIELVGPVYRRKPEAAT